MKSKPDIYVCMVSKQLRVATGLAHKVILPCTGPTVCCLSSWLS